MDHNTQAVDGGDRECMAATSGEPSQHWTVQIHPSTGGQFSIEVSGNETVEGLKKKIARKLKAPKEKLMLLYKDRQLKDGTLIDNSLCHGSRLVLLPAVESGLLSQRHDPTLVQALENLTDDQINDFLSGRSPLTLALRLGDHMVFVQLQLASAVGTKPPTNKPCCQPINTQSVTSTTTPSCQSQPSTSKPPAPHTPLAQRCCRLGNTPTSSPPPATPSTSQASMSTTTTTTPPHSCKSQPRPSCAAGAIIESVKQHAPGIFSGTFSGSLSPSVQDKDGKPRRDINTIMHILTDLLAAAPVYKQHAQKIALQKQQQKQQQQQQQQHHTWKQHQQNRSSGLHPVHKVTRSLSTEHHYHRRHHHHRRDERVRQYLENCHTRNKMEHLQSMMRARQMKRKARREMRGPWGDMHGCVQADCTEIGTSSVSVDSAIEKTITESCYADLKPEYVLA